MLLKKQTNYWDYDEINAEENTTPKEVADAWGCDPDDMYDWYEKVIYGDLD